MKVEEAITRAKAFVREVFANEEVSQIRLEEVEFDDNDNAWLVTIGLMRPIITKQEHMPSYLSQAPLKRTYKVVKIADDGGAIPSVKIRQLHGEE